MAIPVSLADARRQLRMEDDDSSRDTELGQFIADAAAWVEQYTGHRLVAADVTEQFAGFGRLWLKAWPVKPNATPAVSFVDGAGASIAVAGAGVLTIRRPAIVIPAAATRWPPVGAGTVTITVRAGYEPADVVPGNMRRAMLVLIGAFDDDREGGEVLQLAEERARSLCRHYKRRTL